MHDSVLFEACNTSFQTHLQIDPEDFIPSYNWAQTISAPVLGVSTNSPLLFGRELWSETRIALFQQSIDTRQYTNALRDQQSRVTFSNAWAAGNVADLFKNNVAQYKAILAREIEHNSLEELAKGNIPKLQALNLHNSTIYHWNRACYGVGNGKPHVRLENRYLPAGPSTVDEMANFAFWAGLMCARPAAYDDMRSAMDFRDVKANFYKAARTGKDSILHWMGGKSSVADLVRTELLPIAYAGLERMKVDKSDIEHYLEIIDKRACGKTGSQWQIRNYRQFKQIMKEDDAQLALCKAIHANQKENLPVAEWPMVEGNPLIHDTAHTVRHIMSTKLFTVNENDLASMATSIMQWKGIHHVPVEDNSSNFCGLLTWTHMERYMEREGKNDASLVSDIMTTNVRFVRPDTAIKEAIRIMKKYEFGCLPVLKDHHLVGIITIQDVLAFDKE
jgi:CBS domain-containing protein